MANSPALMSSLSLHRPIALAEKINYQPLNDKLKQWFSMYEASYFNFVTKLACDSTDSAAEALMRFRVFRKIFFYELLDFSKIPGQITSLLPDEKIPTIVESARSTLFRTFPENIGELLAIRDVPITYLPFIKISEDPFSEILGQTLKLDKSSFIMVRYGSGKEHATTAHEYLHSISRDLEGAFEEGFIRYSLAKAAVDDDELSTFAVKDKDTIRCNLNSIYYPILLVNILSSEYGDSAVTDAFFKGTSALSDATRLATGMDMKDLSQPFQSYYPKDALNTLKRLKASLNRSISEKIGSAIERIEQSLSI